MSKVYADAVATPEPTDDLILGGSGDNVIVTAGATLKTNTIKDSGGNTLWTSNGSGTLSSVRSGLNGNLVLLSSQTASGASSVRFTSGIDSTYKLYIFKFYDINPATDNCDFGFNASTDGGSNYNVNKTQAAGHVWNYENDSNRGMTYEGGWDQYNTTDYAWFCNDVGGDADQSATGHIWLFNPSSTTYVKCYYTDVQYILHVDQTNNGFFCGYFNTTSAINAIDFKMSTGNFDGVIKMYGMG